MCGMFPGIQVILVLIPSLEKLESWPFNTGVIARPPSTADLGNDPGTTTCQRIPFPDPLPEDNIRKQVKLGSDEQGQPWRGGARDKYYLGFAWLVSPAGCSRAQAIWQ